MARFDPFLARIRNAWSQVRAKSVRRRAMGAPCRVLGYRTALQEARGRALLIYLPQALVDGNGAPRYFNPEGAVVEIATALNESGLVVDAIGINDTDFPLTQGYDLLVAHAGPAYSAIGKQLPSTCPVLDYSTGCHWRAFNEQSERRYRDFAKRRQLAEVPRILRPLVVEHEDFAASRADLVVCLGEETARTFEPFAKRAVAINNSAYTPAAKGRNETSESAGRSFLYSGGSGNVQKGLDLLIEAFAAEPEFHLYLDTPLEPEILATYRRELQKPNLHYCEWGARLQGGFRRIAEKCAFTIHAGLNSGQSTSLVACLAWGLVPVVTTESNLGLGSLEVRIHSPGVAAVRSAIRVAAALPGVELEAKTRGAVEAFHESFSPSAYRDGFRRAIDSLLRE